MITGHELTKLYDQVPALDHVSFEFEEGRIYGIIGHNGAGKTTLLKILAGLITPSSGELSIMGSDILHNPDGVKRYIGYLPEESRLYDTMKVDDYLSFFGEIYGLDAGTIKERKDELLRSLSLEPNGKKLGEFSKGMKRKVAIARSLIHDPSLLIYDEATSGLDPMTSRYIVDYLRTLRDQGKTIILSAHNLYQVEAICDRVMILRRGRMVAMGSMPELREMFGSLTYSIFFTAPVISKIAGLENSAREGGLFRITAQSLEEMNGYTRLITENDGTVERIESHYPSLEEMLVAIGK